VVLLKNPVDVTEKCRRSSLIISPRLNGNVSRTTDDQYKGKGTPTELGPRRRIQA